MSGATKFTIKLLNDRVFDAFMEALRGWQVSPMEYEADSKSRIVTTRNRNVVDVCTEEIRREYYIITKEGTAPSGREQEREA